MRWSTPPPRARGWRSRSPSSRSRARPRRRSRARRRASARPPPTRSTARGRRWTRCTSIAPPASRSSSARARIATRRARELRTREHELAALLARLTSLEELDAARAEYGDGARTILAESPDDVGQMGSVADYLEVDRRYERAVEACLGESLQHVVVATHAHAAAGLRLRARAQRRPGRVSSSRTRPRRRHRRQRSRCHRGSRR